MNLSALFMEVMWGFTFSRISRGWLSSRIACAHERDHITDNELRWGKLASRWFHRDYFIREYLFSTYIKLQVDISSFIYIYLSFLWGKYSLRFRLFYLSVCKKVDRNRDGREHTRFVFFISEISEKHIILLLLWLYKNKSRPFEVSNDALLLSVQTKIMYF